MVPNMKAKYTAEVAPALMKKFQYESAMQIPKLDKIVINVGCGKEANGNSKVIEAIVRDITLISGQKPIITHAKKSMVLKQQAKPKFSSRAYNRCKICGRPHAYLRDFGICRICFRELAYKGQIPGVRKASW